jgi:hypothetical protein
VGHGARLRMVLLLHVIYDTPACTKKKNQIIVVSVLKETKFKSGPGFTFQIELLPPLSFAHKYCVQYS